MRKVVFENREYMLDDDCDVEELMSVLFGKGKGDVPDKKSARLAVDKLRQVADISDQSILISMSGVTILKYGERGSRNRRSAYEIKLTNKRLVVSFEDGVVIIESASHRRNGIRGIGRN